MGAIRNEIRRLRFEHGEMTQQELAEQNRRHAANGERDRAGEILAVARSSVPDRRRVRPTARKRVSLGTLKRAAARRSRDDGQRPRLVTLGSRLARQQRLHGQLRRQDLRAARDRRPRRSASRRHDARRARARRVAAATPSATCPNSARMARQPLALRERQSDAPIARQVAGAGQHEIAQARQAHQRFALAAERRRAGVPSPRDRA